MDYHGDLYLYNVCLGSKKNILLLLITFCVCATNIKLGSRLGL